MSFLFDGYSKGLIGLTGHDEIPMEFAFFEIHSAWTTEMQR
jgi:hypothetical protein